MKLPTTEDRCTVSARRVGYKSVHPAKDLLASAPGNNIEHTHPNIVVGRLAKSA